MFFELATKEGTTINDLSDHSIPFIIWTEGGNSLILIRHNLLSINLNFFL